ncbi:MAG: hypothetical protein IEMM0008_0421 [bacterium]|nr:MAG: hypothetical protein IEMM0008_0421 [bacterium]
MNHPLPASPMKGEKKEKFNLQAFKVYQYSICQKLMNDHIKNESIEVNFRGDHVLE